ncbi:hypothetical protein FOZ63_007863, partial [Perkinsus olseni]
MVPDAGFVLGQLKYKEVEAKAIDGVDLTSEFQKLHLECSDRDAFNKLVSAIRNKLQRWGATSKKDVVVVATTVIAAVKYSAVLEDIEGDWVVSLSLYVAKQVSAMKHPSTTWHKDCTADLNQALVSFLKLKDEEADAASSSVRMRAQNNLAPERSSGSDRNEKAMFRLWSELPLSFGKQWRGP